MKKKIALFLIAAMALSLCACSVPGSPATEPTQDPLLLEKAAIYDKYSELLNALEARDSEQVRSLVFDQIAQFQKEEYTYVDITLDNWQEYFDLEVLPQWYEDLFGDATGVYFTIALTVKPAYRDRLMPSIYPYNDTPQDFSTGDSSIAVEVAWHYDETYLNVDFPSRSITFGEKVPYGDSGIQSEQGSVFYFSGNEGFSSSVIYLPEPYTDYDGALIAQRISELNLCRIQGQLPLRKS